MTLAGDGYLRREISDLVDRLGLTTRVSLIGQIAHDELLQFYREGRADVFVLPSIDLGAGLHEGIPVALMEAMAHRIPVVATATGGIPELLAGSSGVLVAPRQADAIAEAVGMLLQDDQKYEGYANRGRIRVETAFNAKQTTQLLFSELSRITSV